MTVRASRYHDISCGHRVHGHESKCRHLHGHNYRIHFTVEGKYSELDDLGRVMDFSVIKSRLCMWVEEFWDHRFLAWDEDPIMMAIRSNAVGMGGPEDEVLADSIVWVPFNPTAENMGQYLLEVVGPRQLEGTGCKLVYVKIEETAKCSAELSI